MKEVKRSGQWPPVCDWIGCDKPRAHGPRSRGFCAQHEVVYDEAREREARASR